MMNDWKEINCVKEESKYDFLKYTGLVINDIFSKSMTKEILESVKVINFYLI